MTYEILKFIYYEYNDKKLTEIIFKDELLYQAITLYRYETDKKEFYDKIVWLKSIIDYNPITAIKSTMQSQNMDMVKLFYTKEYDINKIFNEIVNDSSYYMVNNIDFLEWLCANTNILENKDNALIFNSYDIDNIELYIDKKIYTIQSLFEYKKNNFVISPYDEGILCWIMKKYGDDITIPKLTKEVALSYGLTKTYKYLVMEEVILSMV